MGEPRPGAEAPPPWSRHGSLALLTDLYQFTMAYGYWRSGRHREAAAFELFFRRSPFQGAFALSAGLGECLAFLRAFRFSPADVEYLESALPATTEKAFFDYLLTVDASEVSVSSAPEGSVVFPRVPMLQVKGPLLVIQLLETTLLCLVNYASLVATNAARFRLITGPDKKLMEMGLRRAQGPDGGLSASKYSYVGGFDFTSNVLAGKLYGIPVRGTVAHSYILSFTSLAEVNPRTLTPQHGKEPVDFLSLVETWLSRVCQLLQAPQETVNRGELAAFVSYAITYPQNFQGLLDTFCVMKSGLPNFCAVALALNELGYRSIGVRLDSGDLAKQSVELRRVFRTCSKHFQVPCVATGLSGGPAPSCADRATVAPCCFSSSPDCPASDPAKARCGGKQKDYFRTTLHSPVAPGMQIPSDKERPSPQPRCKTPGAATPPDSPKASRKTKKRAGED